MKHKPSHFFMLEDYKAMLHSFYKQLFDKEHQADIWFEIITISGIGVKIKGKNNHCKWKISWVKSIIVTTSIPH